MSIASVRLLLIADTLSQTSATLTFEDPFLRQQRIPVGATYFTGYQVVPGFDRRDSNIGYTVTRYSTIMVHNLADPTNETTYLKGDMLTDQAILMDRDFYDVAGVYEVLEVPELDLPERVGNVIEYTVSVQLSLS